MFSQRVRVRVAKAFTTRRLHRPRHISETSEVVQAVIRAYVCIHRRNSGELEYNARYSIFREAIAGRHRDFYHRV